ncbi:DUF421 domain-containing protein [Hymenobacter sp. BT491]|uniref:DUF421 domain-containing protein n=1 Tax=Hymenobacter sp. BT491 TaxID=2766779 RepID=UPI00165378E6|nr:YetF domain-containing protein [Hymenobacter sp. BT491]MBC6990927.1 DUF421 domain-containing protein [Hymenobacter sp. BT491]
MAPAWLDQLLGLQADAHTITTAQMCVRAVVVFAVGLALLRFAGMRTFGSGTAFDMVLKIILGAVLSRAIVAASPFGSTLLASMVLVVLHRLLAIASFYSNAVGKVIKGAPKKLAQDGKLLTDNLRRANITDRDLHEGLREAANVDSISETDIVQLERNGKITVVKKKE